jgi:hypothetical protein
MARPKANIDWQKVDNYLKAQCDGAGIAGILGIHPNTLYEACQEKNKISFSEYSAIKKGEGKELLRARQFQVAMEGDKTMLVWLGKQYLLQQDKSEIDHKNNGESFNNISDAELIDRITKLATSGKEDRA